MDELSPIMIFDRILVQEMGANELQFLFENQTSRCKWV